METIEVMESMNGIILYSFWCFFLLSPFLIDRGLQIIPKGSAIKFWMRQANTLISARQYVQRPKRKRRLEKKTNRTNGLEDVFSQPKIDKPPLAMNLLVTTP